jgi:hypothetical protein
MFRLASAAGNIAVGSATDLLLDTQRQNYQAF